MAVKYTIPYRSIDDTQWRVDILHDAWAGDAIAVRGFRDNACTIEYDGGTDDPFDTPVVSSKANIQLINQGEVDMDELQFAGDRDFVVEVYRGGLLRWKGYLITDNIQQPYLSTPYVVQLSAIDGLNMLEGIEFSIANLPAPSGGAIRCPLNWLRLCLFRTQNLGLPLPIRWVVDLESVETEDDPIAGQITWSPYGDGIIAGTYIDGSGNTQFIYQNCRYIVEGVVKAFGCRIFQADGAWWVVRSNDILPQEITYKECEATLGLPTITTHSVDIGRTVAPYSEPIGDYRFIKEDALITVKPALGMVDVEYDADIRENVLPNGGFDTWVSGSLAHWGFEVIDNDSPIYSEHESLTGRGGEAVVLSNGEFFPATEDAIFGLAGGLPMDASLLFKRITLGFVVMPIEGFDTDPETGDIKWDDYPIRWIVSYVVDEASTPTTYYLNEYGFWQKMPDGGYFDLASSGQAGNVQTYNFVGNPMIGNTVKIIWQSPIDPNFKLTLTHTVTSSEAGSLFDTITGVANKWPNPSLWDINVNVNGTYDVQLVAEYIGIGSGPIYEAAFVSSGKDSIAPDLSIPISVSNMKLGDIASVVFSGRGGSNEILMPDPGPLDGTQAGNIGKLYVRFVIPPDIKYALDDVWVRVEEDNDVYRVTSPVTGNDTTQRITLGVSSSFNGFMVSNMMRSYHQSNRDFVWTDGTTEASLTEHYARQVMRWRYKPSRIFNGTINTRLQDWSFIHLYLIYGFESVFLPLKARHNTELCEVDLVAMEGRDDGVITDVKHYASNSMPLSNYGG